jgi:osmotically-inducible protein OsmY
MNAAKSLFAYGCIVLTQHTAVVAADTLGPAADPPMEKPAAEPDSDELAAEVTARLTAAVLSLDAVEVHIEGHTAFLQGEVRSILAKERAAQLTRSVRGVEQVVNGIRVNAQFSVSPVY